ncbi:MAG: hypothetical protein MRY32_09420 [Rickettsiales bacterium]|nr:hypothetical protein [Rickettsiales bacterium]
MSMFKNTTTAEAAKDQIICVYHDPTTQMLLEGAALSLDKNQVVMMDVFDLVDHPEAQAIAKNAKMMVIDFPSQKELESEELTTLLNESGRTSHTLFCTGNRAAVTDYFERHAPEGSAMRTSYHVEGPAGERIVKYHDAKTPPHNGLFEKPDLSLMKEAMQACANGELAQGTPPTQLGGGLSSSGTVEERKGVQLD